MGVCFGYQVDSPLQFRYLRRGVGEPLSIEEHDGSWGAADGDLIVDWPPRKNRPAHVRLHQTSTGFGLWISDAGWYSISSDAAAITVPPGGNELRREERLWGMPTILTLLRRRDLPMHAAGVEIDGSAVLFGGPTHHGKTTLAACLWDAGHRILSEDLSCITLHSDVIPGPTMIRVRHDVAKALHFRNLEELGVDDDRAHMVMRGTDATDATPVPLRAVVLLDVGTRVEVTRVDPAEAIPNLWLLTFHLPFDDHESWLFKRVVDLAADTPIYRLTRPLEFDSIPRTIEAIQDIASGFVTG